MEKQIITFSANEQKLIKTGGIECYASNIVSYIEAHFDLGANWSGYDSVRAVWSNDNNMSVISTVLDSNGICVVPFEVLKTKGVVKVNLVGSISVSDVLTDRLTSFPCEAVKVTAKAKIEGSETQPITPSQFEQFVQQVIAEVEKVTGMTAQAETLPAGSQATARYENGMLYLGIPQGIQGERGETGADGNGIVSVVYNADYTLTLVFTNGERFTTPPIRGERGPAGADGRDGTDGRDGADGVTPNLTIGTVETLEPTQDAYVTRRGTDDNPIFDFGIPKGDTGEVTMSQLSALLPTDTASGDIASFPDGTDLVPALSVKAQIEPIQSGSGTPSPDNVRPISGHTECVTEVSGVNVWDEEWESGSLSEEGADTPSSNSIRSKNYISVSPNTAYCIVTPYTVYMRYYDANKGFISKTDANGRGNVTAPNGIRTTPSNCAYVRFYIEQTTYNHDISINYPSTDTSYHAYDGDTYTTPLGRTVYGGTLDVVSGELVVDRAMYTFTGDESWSLYLSSYNAWIYGGLLDALYADNVRVISDKFSGQLSGGGPAHTADGDIWLQQTPSYKRLYICNSNANSQTDMQAYTIGASVCYELATPQTYQLTPTEVDLLLGQNNLWTDCGAVEVTYKADVGLYIDKKLSNSGTRSLSMGLTKSATVEAEAEETKTETEETETETELSKAETDKTETETDKTETEQR